MRQNPLNLLDIVSPWAPELTPTGRNLIREAECCVRAPFSLISIKSGILCNKPGGFKGFLLSPQSCKNLLSSDQIRMWGQQDPEPR